MTKPIPADEDGDVGRELSELHEHLEQLFEELLNAFQTDARDEVAALWDLFDKRLRAHMKLEERLILPAFAKEHPAEAEAIRQEHDDIRAQLFQLGLGVDLHLTRDGQVEEFVRRLRRHGEREDILMHRFVQEQMGNPLLRRAIAADIVSMKPVMIAFITKHGQTQRIAHYIFAQLLAGGQPAVLCDLSSGVGARKATLLLADCAHALLVAPLYGGHYPRPFRRFVSQHAALFNKLPCTFVSVSLTQAAVQDLARSDEERSEALQGLAKCVAQLSAATKFQPADVHHVAGALAYTQYGPIVRWVMKRIARHEHASTDTSRDHELTDWDALRGWIAERFLTPEEALASSNQGALSAGGRVLLGTR